MRAPVLRRLSVAILALLILGVYTFPYIYLFLTSLKPPAETFALPPTILPASVTGENYATVLGDPSIIRAFANSLIIATGSTLLSLALAVPAAYGITRFRTRAGRIFIFGVLLARMIPYVAVAIPFLGMMSALRLADTHLSVIVAHTTINLPLAIWLMASYFEDFPVELEEAALVEGCDRWGALWRVVIPVVLGGIAVTATFAYLASWSEFLFALILTQTDAKTATVAIAEFKTNYGISWGPMSATAILYSLPVVILALAFQRRMVSGLTLGAVKG